MTFTTNKELASLMLQIDNEIIDYCIRLYDCPSLADIFSSEKDRLVKRELIKNKIVHLAIQMILFCHSEDEFSNFHEWRVFENELMSTEYRLKKLQEAGIEERKIRDNLNK